MVGKVCVVTATDLAGAELLWSSGWPRARGQCLGNAVSTVRMVGTAEGVLGWNLAEAGCGQRRLHQLVLKKC